MAPQQRIKVANEKASKNITLRGNVPKSTVSTFNVIPYGITQKIFKNFPVFLFFVKSCVKISLNVCYSDVDPKHL